MSPSGTHFAGSVGRCRGLKAPDQFGGNVSHSPFLASIAPGPAETVVEQFERFASSKFADLLRIFMRSAPQHCRFQHLPSCRLGVMRRNDPARERDVGKILAIGIELGVRQVRWA